MLFTNTPALQIRVYHTLKKHHGKSSDELQTAAEQNNKINAIFDHFFNCTLYQNSDILQNLKVLLIKANSKT